MVLDHRRVQTAVLGNRESADPVYLPMDRQEAQEFRRRHLRSTFWCGFLLGGCGGQLSQKIYRDRVSHFAHHAAGNECTREHGGLESADHLYASKQTNRWLNSLGRPAREPQFTGDFASGGTCRRVVLPSTDEHPAILFEFSTGYTKELDDLFTRMRDQSPSWLVQENMQLTRRLLRENNIALRFRMRTKGLERVLEVGTVGLSGSIRWEPIDTCTFTPEGIRTPRMEELFQARQQQVFTTEAPGESSPPQEPEPEPHPLVTSLESSLHQGNLADIRNFSQQLRSALRSSKDPGIEGFRGKVEKLLDWASRKLEYGKEQAARRRNPLHRSPAEGSTTTESSATWFPSDRSESRNEAEARKSTPLQSLQKPPLITLITDAEKAYDTEDQSELRRIREELRQRRDSLVLADQLLIDLALEMFPSPEPDQDEQQDDQPQSRAASPQRSGPIPPPEESTLRTAIDERREELRRAPTESKPGPPRATEPSLDEFANRINSRRTR